MVVSVAAGGVVDCSMPSVPDVSVFLLHPSAKRSAHVNTRTRATANIFFISLSPPSTNSMVLRLGINVVETLAAKKAKHHCLERCFGAAKDGRTVRGTPGKCQGTIDRGKDYRTDRAEDKSSR